MSAKADEAMFNIANLMAASLVEPTPECPDDGTGEWGFMVGLSPMMIGSVRPEVA
jgi:hypothetical protein